MLSKRKTSTVQVAAAEGWLYVAGIMDAYSRRVVGWAMSDNLTTTLPLTALQMAMPHQQPRAAVLHHSDRGC